MDLFENTISSLGAIVWGPHMLVLLLGVGLYLTIRLRFVQLRRFGLSFRLLLGHKDYGESTKELKTT